MGGEIRGDVLPADGAVPVLAEGVGEAGGAEGVAACDGDGPAVDHHADGTVQLFNLVVHLILLYTLGQDGL